MPTEEMSRLLNISQTKPILEKVSRGYLVDGRCLNIAATLLILMTINLP